MTWGWTDWAMLAGVATLAGGLAAAVASFYCGMLYAALKLLVHVRRGPDQAADIVLAFLKGEEVRRLILALDRKLAFRLFDVSNVSGPGPSLQRPSKFYRPSASDTWRSRN